MRAKTLSDLLQKGDRVAVSNITGREASQVSADSHKYCGNIVGGWALGKSQQTIETSVGTIPVYGAYEELLRLTPPERHPNKIVIYSPPEAVYGEIKEVVKHSRETLETIFVITEHVAAEVMAKIRQICAEADIDIIGCNTLGMINAHDAVRAGAVGGTAPREEFQKGSVAVLSNSGNMVNTISSYLRAAGMGISFGMSTGKDILILTPLKDLLPLAEADPATRLIVLYIEPGGVYEQEAVAMMEERGFSKPIVVYVAGKIAETHDVSLGHAGAVVEGRATSASAKMRLFDDYFGVEPFRPRKRYKRSEELREMLRRGIRVRALHDIPRAVSLVAGMQGIKRDMARARALRLNPWFVNLGDLGKKLPAELALARGVIPEPFATQFRALEHGKLGGRAPRQLMRNASHVGSNDGVTPRLYGYRLMELMAERSFAAAAILTWTGELPRDAFDERLVEMTLIASITNGPGTISAQGAKLSTSAGNSPNTAMIGTLASIGEVHGGNGARAAKFLLRAFNDVEVDDPYDETAFDVAVIARREADAFKRRKIAAKEAGEDYERIPSLGHPVFRNDAVNYDPRERVISEFIRKNGRSNMFLDFYHHLAKALKDNGSTRRVMAVNLDAALACVWLGVCWPHLREKRMTIERAVQIPFVAFALGRAAGGAGEYLDHQDHGTQMDMRVPVAECRALTRERKLN